MNISVCINMVGAGKMTETMSIGLTECQQLAIVPESGALDLMTPMMPA